MKSRWFWTILGAVPFLSAVITLQSCGGEGGPIGGDGGGGLPSITQQFLDLLSPEQRAASAVGSERCADGACHGGRAHASRGDGDTPIYTTWLETKHAEVGVSCERCHGNGSVHASNPTKENILTYPKSTAPVVCGQCHGPTYQEFMQSSHRHIVEHPVADGMTNPTQYGRSSRCMSCHSGLYRTMTTERGIDPANANEISDAEISQIAQWGSDPQFHADQSANCVTCHDPHQKTGNLTDDSKEVQLRHPVFSTDTAPIEPGTTAASFTVFNHVCAQCHNGRGADGRDSRLSQSSSTSRPNMHDSNQFNTLMGVGGAEGPTGPVERNMAHATAPGQCSKCHMPDSRHTFTVSFDKGCAPCHTAADAASRMNALNQEMTNALLALRTKMEAWANTTFNSGVAGYGAGEIDARLRPFLWDYSSNISTEATELGLDTNDPAVMPPSTHQTAIPIEVRRARHNYYFILRDSSICPHNPPYARYLLTVANENMDSVLGPGFAGRAPTGLSMQQKRQILERDRIKARKADSHGSSEDE